MRREKYMGPQVEFSEQLHAMKYRQPGETFRDAMTRVASALTDEPREFHAFRDILLDMRFMPAGRVQAAMGAVRDTTPYNCFSGLQKFLTSEGVRTFAETVGQKVRVLSPVTGLWHETEVQALGQQDVYEYEIAFGCRRDGATFRVRATADHSWILHKRRDRTTSLKPGDLLAVTRALQEIDPDGFVHGFVFGDGTKLKETIPTFAVGLFGERKQGYRKFFEESSWLRTERLGDRDTPFYRLRPADGRDLKKIPEPEEYTAAYIAGFVQGWICADGCVGDDSDNSSPAVLNSINIEDLEWVRDWLPLAGYTVSGGIRHHMGDGIGGGKRIKPLGCLYIRRSAHHRGMRVVSRTLVGRETVYCVSVPEGGSAFTLENGLSTGNCFVSGTIPDSFTTRDNEFDSSIMHRAEQAAQTMRMGGGIGYDFSTLRPRGSLIRKLQSNSTGPLSFMRIFDAVCRATSSAGHRRGAQMGVLRVDHPDIVEFVNAKHDQETLSGFNISVAVTDEFMEAVARNSAFELKFEGEVHSTVDARELWETIMRSTWDWAEPGVLFIDTINRMNNLWYCETIAATNPCAEQPLPPHGACLLGSVNLARYVRSAGGGGGGGTKSYRLWSLDLDQLADDIPHIVRAMDNIVDRARYPLPEQETEARSKRRMGIGVTGMANAIEALGHPYGSTEYLRVQDSVLALINRACYRASALLAADRGSFPMYDAEHYLGGQFVQSLDDETVDMIRFHGIRNSHLTSIAPTGTISMCADNVSSGIEPVFSVVTERPVNTPNGVVIADLEDYGSARHGTVPRLAAEVTAAEHVEVLASATRHVDSAVSKTCNVDGRMPWADFKGIYTSAWERGCKGLTTFNADGKRMALLTGKSTQKAPPSSDQPTRNQPEADRAPEACVYDPATGTRSCDQ